MIERLKSLPRLFQIAVVFAVVAASCCCGIIGVALVWPTADTTATPAVARSVPTLRPSFTPRPLTGVPTATTERPTDTPSPSSERAEATVVEVVDGDTIKVAIAGTTYSLRYIGIDTPEAGDPMGTEATAANRQLVEGQTVYLVKDVSETDRYDRLLRYVYLADGTFVNAELVRLGFAQAKAYPPDTKYQDLFAQMEQEADADTFADSHPHGDTDSDH
jgi:endonuclease YncB( thermonuclease family)